MKDAGQSASPKGFAAVGVFLVFGAIMAGLAGTTLIWPNTPLTRMWTLNPPAYKSLAPLGATAGIPFLVLSLALALGALGWFRRRRWGWALTVIIIVTQVLGGVVHLITREWVAGATGVIIASALLWYLLRASVRAFFADARR